MAKGGNLKCSLRILIAVASGILFVLKILLMGIRWNLNNYKLYSYLQVLNPSRPVIFINSGLKKA